MPCGRHGRPSMPGARPPRERLATGPAPVSSLAEPVSSAPAPHGDTQSEDRTAPVVADTDLLLLDLDGTVYRGGFAIDGAPDTIRACAERGVRSVYVTNNASRRPSVIADQLTAAGIRTEPGDVVTSAQAGATLLASLVPPGTRTLVVGSAHLREEVVAAGLTPVGTRDGIGEVRSVGAVIQGFDPGLAWQDLAAAAYGLAGGATWVATNTDMTVPTAHGIAPGSGSLTAAVAAAAARIPQVAGKPETPLLDQAVAGHAARRPLLIGDRLDTDIAAGVRAGMPTMLVLTGVSGPADLLGSGKASRPTYLSADLRGLLTPALTADRDASGAWSCGGWTVAGTEGRLQVSGQGDRVAGLWALANAWWALVDTAAEPMDGAAALARLGWDQEQR